MNWYLSFKTQMRHMLHVLQGIPPSCAFTENIIAYFSINSLRQLLAASYFVIPEIILTKYILHNAAFGFKRPG